MMRKGIDYDAGRVTVVNWRPDYSTALVRREMEIIQADLHCMPSAFLARATAAVREKFAGPDLGHAKKLTPAVIWGGATEKERRAMARSGPRMPPVSACRPQRPRPASGRNHAEVT
jgi:hypothetical protein